MKLIIVDGCDASGKDTHAIKIKQMFEERDKRVEIRSHPEADNFFGRKAKDALLKDGVTNKFKASIFYALDVFRTLNRYYKEDDIDVLIVVRYLIGTAYLPKPLSELSYKVFKNILPTSEYMFYLDVDPEDAMERLKKRKDLEMFENIKDICKVREQVFSIIDDDWHVIDTGKTIEENTQEIKEILIDD